jgi:hypothetical protein
MLPRSRCPKSTSMLADIQGSRDTLFTRVEALVEIKPLRPLLTSPPSVSIGAVARILTEIVGKARPQRLWLPTQASPWIWRCESSIPATIHPGTVTKPSREPCSFPHSRPEGPRSEALFRPERSGHAPQPGPRHSGPPAPSTAYSETAPSTHHDYPQLLVENQSPTPRSRQHAQLRVHNAVIFGCAPRSGIR